MEDTEELQIPDDLLNIDLSTLSDDLKDFHADETVQKALNKNIDLKKYSIELEEELKVAESEAVTQYMDNSTEVVGLHEQMVDCDGVLARMQEMLLGFQADLSGISEEIRYLQDESLSMSVRLKNRRDVESKLRYFIDNCSISADDADSIVNGQVNETFLNAVIHVSKKLKFLQGKSYKNKSSSSSPSSSSSSLSQFTLKPQETYAGKTLLPELKALRDKSIYKIKDYFTSQINMIKKPKTNIQMVQQNALVRYAPLYAVLKEESLSSANELKTLYIDTMNRTLVGLFKNYYSQLIKLDAKLVSKNDLLGSPEMTSSSGGSTQSRSLFSSNAISTTSMNEDDKITFNLSERQNILNKMESEPILVHVAVAETIVYPYEALIRSLLKHLVDAATSEFLFILDFFKGK